jgi:hypothetical protein
MRIGENKENEGEEKTCSVKEFTNSHFSFGSDRRPLISSTQLEYKAYVRTEK